MHQARFRPYTAASGGWGSAKSVGQIIAREHASLSAPPLLLKQNKPQGFACVSCAWAKPGEPHPMEFCENGAKATAWEATSLRAGADFFAAQPLNELRQWTDHDLEQQGRLTEPLRYDPESDRYLPTPWAQAFEEIGAQLRALAPHSVVFYASGRASLEASFMYQLLARAYGCNNLPDSSNMCHESTSVGLQESIGVPVGTVTLEDFKQCDCFLFFGQNVGTNSPRMLHDLQDARRRDVPIITFNPLRERGLERFVNPQSPTQMLTPDSTLISTQYHQVAIGGDTAALMGVAKALLDLHDQTPVLDEAFIAEHTEGFDAFAATARSYSWSALEQRAGITRAAMEATAQVYARSERVIAVYGMGLTQHRHGVQNVQMVVNLMLLRGNIGKPGAGVCPVRGHSNVQGQRTVGITEDPAKVPGDKIKARFGFSVPEQMGLTTVDTCAGILDGSVKGFVGLGGNFLAAVPDTHRMQPAWGNLELSVQVATKLNRTHLYPGRHSWLLPCLGRTEIHRQNGVAQAYSTEDSTGCIHGWHGQGEPASASLLSEVAIIAGLAQAVLPADHGIPWAAWRDDHALIRAGIAAIYPDTFHDFEHRMWEPGGFHRPLPAAQRQWKTKTGKAQFVTPKQLAEDDDVNPGRQRRDVLQLMTLRSNDQFNTTIYGYDDRFRGIHGTRMVLLMHRNDIARLGYAAGDWVNAFTAVETEVERKVGPLQIIAYDIPEGCCAGYYPECNPLVPLWHHAERSKVPASKSIPITLAPSEPGARPVKQTDLLGEA